MVTRFRAGIIKPKHVMNLLAIDPNNLLHAILSFLNPKGFKYAYRNQHWCDAIHEELKVIY